MSTLGKAFIAGVMIVAPSIGLVAVAEAQLPIRIGVSVSMSGSNEVLSQNRGRAYQLCVKHANEKGGVLGRPVELVVEDDKSHVATAVQIQWEPSLVSLRAGGLVPVARRFPGAREFVEAYRKEYPGADLSYHSASGYASCGLLIEAIRQVGSLDGERVRDAISKFDTNTVFGRFKVDSTGYQVGQQMLAIQWQDGKKVIVWPEELAPGKPLFPTPPWSQR